MKLAGTSPFALGAQSPPSRERVGEAARQLETQFAQMLIKSMRSTAPGDAFSGNDSTYRDMYDQQLAKTLTKGRGLGLAGMIERQLARDTGAIESGPALDTTLPGRGTTPGAMPLTLSATPMQLSLRAPGGGGVASTGLGGVLPLASTHGGVSLQALPMPALPMAQPPEAMTFDADAPVDGSSPEAFVESIWPHAQKAAAELGVPAKALVAQAALETGWGRRLAQKGGDSSNNLFGIKAGSRWKGDSVNTSTHEYVDGVRRTERADFRAYGSAAESFADYTRLLGNDRYAHARGTGNDTHRFASALQKAGYATDPRYAAKLTAIANGPTISRTIARLEGAPGLPSANAPQYAALSAPTPSTTVAPAVLAMRAAFPAQ